MFSNKQFAVYLSDEWRDENLYNADAALWIIYLCLSWCIFNITMKMFSNIAYLPNIFISSGIV